MIVSFQWLQDYVDISISHEELAERLGMAGLNHEGTEPVGDDFAIDLEVTSNRPDCLGHIGVAREAAVLLKTELKIPTIDLNESARSAAEATSVEIQTDHCPRYIARIIRGVKVGPSPDWLVQKLSTLGVASINNVVDITNFVMLENGQPLHAFDLSKLSSEKIVVRQATKGEKLEAINHHTYELNPDMCVIADAEKPVALAGVMGGADSEVTESTVDLLIEAADFAPLSVRSTARALKLFSDSSFRFERGVDPEGIDWASRRCCQLILEIAGGELCSGSVDVGDKPATREAISLRLPQIERVLGISVPTDEVAQILIGLGGKDVVVSDNEIKLTPPSWRRDLTREIDLIEEVARIHGYDKIPEDAAVPMVSSTRSDYDRLQTKVRHSLVARGFFEVMTRSVSHESWSGVLPVWSTAEPLEVSTSMVKGESKLRQTLAPSLLAVMQRNEALGNSNVRIFETAKVYLPKAGELPDQPTLLALAAFGDFFKLKGAIEGLLQSLHSTAELISQASAWEMFSARQCDLQLEGKQLGVIGELNAQSLKRFKIKQPVAIAEIDLSLLERVANLVPQHSLQSAFPSTSQDLNFILDESVRWAELRDLVRGAGGEDLEAVEYQETYRNEKADGRGKKRVLLTFTLRAADRTLTGDEAEEIRNRIIAKISTDLNAQLVS